MHAVSLSRVLLACCFQMSFVQSAGSGGVARLALGGAAVGGAGVRLPVVWLARVGLAPAFSQPIVTSSTRKMVAR